MAFGSGPVRGQAPGSSITQVVFQAGAEEAERRDDTVDERSEPGVASHRHDREKRQGSLDVIAAGKDPPFDQEQGSVQDGDHGCEGEDW